MAPVQQVSPVPNVPDPVTVTGCDRQPHTAKRSTPHTRKKCSTKRESGGGNLHFSDLETKILLDVAETHKPFCNIAWTVVAEAYNRECQLHSIDTFQDGGSLCRKFDSVRLFLTHRRCNSY